MTIDELRAEIEEDLTAEMSGEADFSAAVLSVKVKGAIRELRLKLNLPKGWGDAKAAEKLYEYYPVIVNVARYDYNQRGSEGQTNHSENSINRTWADRDELFRGVHAYVGAL